MTQDRQALRRVFEPVSREFLDLVAGDPRGLERALSEAQRNPVRRQRTTPVPTTHSHIECLRVSRVSVGTVSLPVGEYGSEWSERLSMAGAALEGIRMELANRRTGVLRKQERWADHAAEHREILRRGSAWTQTLGPTHSAVSATSQDGLLSVVASLAQLTAYRVDGYDHAASLARALIANDTVERFSMWLTPGHVQPMTSAGLIYATPPVTLGDARLPVLSSGIKEVLRPEKQRWHAQLRRLRESGENVFPAAAGSGCVMAHIGPGEKVISDTATLVLNCADRIRDMRLSPRSCA